MPLRYRSKIKKIPYKYRILKSIIKQRFIQIHMMS